MIERKLVRAREDSPERCVNTHSNIQCPFERVPGSQFCQRHGGMLHLKKVVKEELRNYRVAKWQTRVNELADNDKVKSLREEVGITRMILEETLNRCNDSTDLLLYSNKISDLVGRIEKLVTSCHRLELSVGQLLDKSQILHIGSVIVEIISAHVTDETTLELIGEQIIQVITSVEPVPKELVV